MVHGILVGKARSWVGSTSERPSASGEDPFLEKNVDLLDVRGAGVDRIHPLYVAEDIAASSRDMCVAPGDVWESLKDRKPGGRMAHGVRAHQPSTSRKFLSDSRLGGRRRASEPLMPTPRSPFSLGLSSDWRRRARAGLHRCGCPYRSSLSSCSHSEHGSLHRHWHKAPQRPGRQGSW